MLGHRRAHQQPAIRPPPDSQVRRIRVFLVDQVVRRREEIVEYVLFLAEHPGLMPLLAVLAATAHIRHRKPSALLQPPRIHWVPIGCDAGVESAVAGQQQRGLASTWQTLLACDEHWDARAVLRREEDLPYLVMFWTERDLRLRKDTRRARVALVAINSWRHVE